MSERESTKDIVARVADSSEWNKEQSKQAVKAVCDAVTNALVDGKQVVLTGFGTFLVRTRPAVMGRNVRTGEAIQIPEKRLVRFRAGKALAEAVNK
jgi:nucleoid DNA-binding protein